MPENARREIEGQRLALGDRTAELCDALRWESLGLSSSNSIAARSPMLKVMSPDDRETVSRAYGQRYANKNNEQIDAQIASAESADQVLAALDPIIRNSCNARCRGYRKTNEHFDDMVQSVRLEVIETYKKRPSKSRRYWYAAIRKMSMHCFDTKSKAESIQSEQSGIPDFGSGGNPGEIWEEIRKCAESFKDPERAFAVIRSRYEGYSSDETCAKLGIFLSSYTWYINRIERLLLERNPNWFSVKGRREMKRILFEPAKAVAYGTPSESKKARRARSLAAANQT